VTCRVGENIVLCDGKSGGWRVARLWCPWCSLYGDPPRRGLSVPIYGGYGGMDCICGDCGFAWSAADEWWTRMDPQDNEERVENIALVAGTPDPGCWKCHDTGDLGMPGIDAPGEHPCDCEGRRRSERSSQPEAALHRDP